MRRIAGNTPMTAKKANSGGEIVLKGLGVSPGVVSGPVFLLAPSVLYVARANISEEQVEHEICRLEDALIETRRQIKEIQKNLVRSASVGDASILDAHLMVLDDRAFIEEIVGRTKRELLNVEWVVKNVADRYADTLASLDDEYLRERVADVRDVARRIIRNLYGDAPATHAEVPRQHIVVAEDLAPSETATMRREMVSGFATDMGSWTSHTAVMARALGIPAVVGLHDITRRVNTGDQVLIDGIKGLLIMRPTAERLEEYGKVLEERRSIVQSLTGLKDQPAETKDGRRIVLSANTEGVEELDAVIEYGAEGVGLFRSEYLYLTSGKEIGEDEQAEVYSQVASRLAPAPVIIRTLDIGGDKFVHHTQLHREANPFLGCRSIRLSLRHPEQFKAQLRAVLRAGSRGNVKLMYPMISNVSEIVQSNVLLEEAKQELRDRGMPFNEKMEVGVMVEIPSAALSADLLAEHVDFFSLGTNDLIQYTLAVDRINEEVAYLYQPANPAVLKLIRETVAAGHRHGIWVGLCGEMAADPLMVPLLVGMEVDELSVAPVAVPLVKDAVRSVTYADSKDLAAKALKSGSAEQVVDLCRELMGKAAPELLELI